MRASPFAIAGGLLLLVLPVSSTAQILEGPPRSAPVQRTDGQRATQELKLTINLLAGHRGDTNPAGALLSSDALGLGRNGSTATAAAHVGYSRTHGSQIFRAGLRSDVNAYPELHVKPQLARAVSAKFCRLGCQLADR
jgi:hypothetical protein